MKIAFPKITLIASLLAVTSMVTVSANAADQTDKAERKAKKEAADLAKCDKNKNGKLDADDQAALKAEAEKKKAVEKK